MTYLFNNNTHVTGNVNIFNSNAAAITANTRLPVDIGNTTINISGNVNINTPNTITVNSTPEDPVHVHITEVGNSGMLAVPYLPILGNVVVTTIPTVNIGNYPVTQNVSFANQTVFVNGGLSNIGNLPVTQNVSFANQTVFVNGGLSNIGNLPVTQNVSFANQSVYLNGGNVSIFNSNGATITNTTPLPVTGNVTIASGEVTVVPDLSVGDFYGEPYAVQITPVVQMDGRYGIDSREMQTYTGGGGSVGANLSCLTVSSNTTVGSYGLVRSRRFNTYKAGQSHIARAYLKFQDPAAGTSQRWGIQNQENAFYIGYNGTDFGVLRTYNGRVPLYRLTVTSYTGNQTVTITLNGTAYTTTIAVGESIQQAAQRIALDSGYGGNWLTIQRGNTVEFLYTGALAPLGGTFSVTSSGNLVASIANIQAGVAATNEWTYPGGTDANGNYFPPLPTWLDPTTFQQYQIKYSWAGANFFVLDPTTGRYTRLFAHYHVGDTITQPQIANPAFKTAALALNTGGSVPVTVYAGEMSMALEGIANRNKYNYAAATTQTSLTANALHHLLSIQNALTFADTINTLELLLQDFTATTQCNDPAEVYLFLDAPLTTGVHDFEIVGNHQAGVSKATGTIDATTNVPLCTFVVGVTGSSVQFPLNQYRLAVSPGATISIAVKSTAVIQKVAAALVWYVD